MRQNQKKKKIGFTLVELLAVVVIMGIIMMISIPAVTRWIDRSKAESKESQKNTLVMAAQSYAQQNSNVLPKMIGQTKVISAEELRKSNYLKEDLQDSDKKSCMNSFVKVYKYDKNAYTYTPYLYCEGEVIPTEIESTKPSISISFYSKNTKSDQIQDVSISSFKAIILGGTNGSKTFGIDGYSYSIGVKYTSDVNEKVVEIYNSGTLNGGGKESLIIEKDLSDYTDITKVNEYIVTVEAYNRDGGHEKVSASSVYRDSTPPVCGKITGEPSEGSWLKTKGSTRTISVLCSDGDGAGCVKDKYTKTFDEEMEFGIIQISDNAGNTTDCKVRVNIDWTYPSLTVSAFKRTSSGGKGASAGTAVSASHSTRGQKITLKTYSNSHNGWLNKANYAHGVYYEITVDDNIKTYVGQWSYNSTGIYKETASNINNLQNASPTIFSATNKTTNVSLSGQGMRRALYTITDRAGNKTEVHILANIDTTDPTATITTSHIGYTDGITATVGCIDNESKCASGMGTHTGLKSSQTYTVYDNAGNSGSKRVTVTDYDCHCSNCHHTANTCKSGSVPKKGFLYCPFPGAADGPVCAASTPTGPNAAFLTCGACTYYVTDNCATGSPNECQYGCDTCYK